MPTHHPLIFLSQRLSPGFSSFLSNILIELRNEMNRVSNAFFQYNIPNQDLVGVDNLFASIERTWMGMFNNALVRNTDIPVFQEFSVWNRERLIGRCDYLIRLKSDFEEVDIVTEAKCYEFIDDWARTDDHSFYKRILDQANVYYKVESLYYEKEVWLMALIFEWIRNKERLEVAKGIMNNWNEIKDAETDFLSLYYGDVRGVFVYGKLTPAKEYGKEKF